MTEADDPDHERAEQLARCSLEDFVRRFQRPPPGQTELMLKARFTGPGGIERLWVSVFKQIGDSTFRGTVENDPAIVSLEFHDTVTVRASDVFDWYAVERDTLVGGFSIRAYRNRLSPADQVAEDSVRPYVIDDDTSALRRLPAQCR